MREIKFRVWDKKENAMERDIYSIEWVAGGMKVGGPGYHISNGWASVNDTLKDKLGEPDLILMQYTGLKDKNGKEIYEGDIVRGIVDVPIMMGNDFEHIKMGGEVFYDHSGFSLKVIQSMCDPERNGMVNYFDFVGDDGSVFEKMEVIGNIYENPDLLTNEK